MRNKWFSISVIIIFILTSYSVVALKDLNQITTPNEDETSSHIIIHSDDAASVASTLKSEGFDVLYGSITSTSLELIVTPKELNSLQMRGFEIEILERGRPFIEIQKERNENSQGMLFPGYPDLSEIIDEMYDVESSYPSICKVYDLTETYGVSPTYEDRHIYAMKISDNVNQDEDEPNFLMVSCHHAREIVTPVIALYAIEQLTKEYSYDPDITAAVDDYEIWISPVWNPDGYEYCYYHDNMWRKNLNPPHGVDLNRNYPFGWDSECSGSTDPYSETYKGSGPASEAETQTMIAFSNDRHFAKVIDYHSHGREVLHGYSCHSHPFSSFYESEAISLSTEAGYGGAIRTPSAEGEHYEWQIWANGSFAFLMETHTEFQPSYSSALAEAEQVWLGTIWLFNRPISVSGHIVDSITGEPLVASINIIDVSFSNEEEFFSEPSYGRYHLFLPPGTYTLEVSCEDYYTWTQEITVTSDSYEILEIELDGFNEPPNKPSINGPPNGKVGVKYEYTFTATDPNLDVLEYYIKWDDGYVELWEGPYDSGEEAKFSHVWEKEGTYTIQAKVRDEYGVESDWEYLEVTMPRNKMLNGNLFLRLKNQIPIFISELLTEFLDYIIIISNN
jgi:hypothetical protein